MTYCLCSKHSVRWNQDESEECPLCRLNKERVKREEDAISSLKDVYLRKIERLERRYEFPKVIDLIAQQFPASVFKDSREQYFVRQRKVLIQLLRDRYSFSFPAIAAFFRKQGLTSYHHTTALHHYYNGQRNKTRSITRKTDHNQREESETTHEI